MNETANTQPDPEVVSTGGFDRLEAIRLKLCAVGLHPGYHDTAEKAADAVCEMIAYFRSELANPPADVCGLVMEKYGVEGFTGDKPATHRLVPLSNNRDVGRDGSADTSPNNQHKQL